MFRSLRRAGVFRRVHKNQPEAQHAGEFSEFALAAGRKGDDHLLRALGGEAGIFGDGRTFGVTENGPDGPLAAHVHEVEGALFEHAGVGGVRVLEDFVAEDDLAFGR